MSGSGECRLKGLCIKASPLGENDRLITILTDEQGIVRLAVPGARRPKSSLAAATPLTYLSLQIFGKRSLCNRATSDAFIFRLLWGSSMDENPSLGK